jgi:hypothetical protein
VGGGAAGAGAAGSGSGGSGAGATCDGAVVGDRFELDRIYLVGTVSSGSCGATAIAAPECPNSAAVGFDCQFDGNSDPRQNTAQLRPDGALLYIGPFDTNTFQSRIREFRCDGCPYLGSNANDYPDDVLTNDPVIPTSCDGIRGTLRFFLSPTGSLYVGCGDETWRDEAGSIVYSEQGSTIAYVGYSELALTQPIDNDYYSYAGATIVSLATGSEMPVTGLPEGRVFALRAAPPDRFLVALSVEGPEPGGIWALWEIDASGAASRRGQYPRLPTEVTLAPGAKLLSNGVLFQFGDGPNGIDAVIVRREIGGTSDVVYSEEDDPNVEVHISGLLTGQ